MRAIVFENFKTFPSLKDVDKPTPGPGEVLLKVAGAGACHSDVAIYDTFEEKAAPARRTHRSYWPRELRLG